MGLDQAYTSAPWSEVPDPSQAAVALGIADQLTNILRDVGEDRGRGRACTCLSIDLAALRCSGDRVDGWAPSTTTGGP
jgi:hypothetical protein